MPSNALIKTWYLINQISQLETESQKASRRFFNPNHDS